MVTGIIMLLVGFLAGAAYSRLRYGEAVTKSQAFANRLQRELGQQRDVNIALLDMVNRARTRGADVNAPAPNGDRPAFDQVTYASGTLARFPDLEEDGQNGKA